MRSTSSTRSRGLPRVASKLSIASSYADHESDFDHLHTSTSTSEREDGAGISRTGTATVNSSAAASRTSSPVRQARSRSNSTLAPSGSPSKSRSGSITGVIRPSAIPVRPKTPSSRPPSSLGGKYSQPSKRSAEEVALPPSRIASTSSMRSVHSNHSATSQSPYPSSSGRRPSATYSHSHPSSTSSGLGPARRPMARNVSGHRHSQSYGGVPPTSTRTTSRLGYPSAVAMRSPSPGSSASTETSSSGTDSVGPLTPDTPTSLYGDEPVLGLGLVILKDGEERVFNGREGLVRSMRSSTHLRNSAIPPSSSPSRSDASRSSRSGSPSKFQSNYASSSSSSGTIIAPPHPPVSRPTPNFTPVRPALTYRSRKRSSTISEETPTLTLSLIAARKRAQGNASRRGGGNMGPPTSIRGSVDMLRQMSGEGPGNSSSMS